MNIFMTKTKAHYSAFIHEWIKFTEILEIYITVSSFSISSLARVHMNE